MRASSSSTLERLHDVVVGSGVEPGDSVSEIAAGADDHDRNPETRGAKAAYDLQAR
jgi:hypothetical protein